MSRTNDDSATWAALRSSRSDPPAATVNNSERRATYVAALEQSEQLFKAASAVGPATAPILLYYGISQAGRAIIAAARSVRDNWRLSGHGINRGDLTVALPAVRVYAEGVRGSFVRLSAVLDSPIWDKDAEAVELTALWDALPQTIEWPLRNDDRRRTAHLLEYHDFGEPHPLLGVSLCGLPRELAESASLRKDLALYLRSYPTLRGYSYVKADDGPDADPAVVIYSSGRGEVHLNLVVDNGRSVEDQARRAYFETIATKHGEAYRSFYLVPVVGENKHPMHPLMTWWAVLYTLSMLARYQPAEWATYINVDRSSHAVPIEHLLAEALSAVPGLIASTIRAVR
ncbi:YaaC-like Protein [Micromonospora matsumotoense]|uniref:YaaC-like Protein n=1 Tax=Micromonospora matsumotoense TaxID=121616 RepID=A0A1C5AU53_9ACTN|nr:YaaC family protein [Micromonospora matsumotoense]SCF48739.1 YaaC-like Protein [Micromonospora matsumotoense]